MTRARCFFFANLLVLAFAGMTGEAVADGSKFLPFGSVQLPGDWNFDRAFSDEFETGRLDEDKWHDHDPIWNGREPSRFLRENVAVKDGRLTLTSRQAKNGIEGPEYLAAAVKSRRSVRYGHFEVRARAGASSVSSAFWLYARDDVRWTEIDVFELSGSADFSRILHTNAHLFYDLERGKKAGEPVYFFKPIKLVFDVHKDFHVYGLNWTPDLLQWWVDGRLVRTLKNDYWHQPLNIMLDCEVFVSWFGLPDAAALPAAFEIDYLRVWRPNGAGL